MTVRERGSSASSWWMRGSRRVAVGLQGKAWTASWPSVLIPPLPRVNEWGMVEPGRLQEKAVVLGPADSPPLLTW